MFVSFVCALRVAGLTTGKLLKGDSCCAHGDTVVYPLARVEVEVDGQTHEVESAVSKTLSMSMLMGTDVPVLSALVMT